MLRFTPRLRAPSRPQISSGSSGRGFSLLEMTLALSIGGMLLGSIWQLMGTQSQTREAMGLASQAYAVAQAGQSYINANSTTLLALTQLNAINNVARIKITASDTGDTTTNVQDSGYLPNSFSNNNSFGQSYALYVQRQDGGAAGVDASDRLIGLLITTGGASISDDVGSRAASGLGAAGGFIRAGGNTASGTAGGWSINFSSATGWSTTPGTSGATAGHLAVLTALLVNAPSMGSGGGAGSIDGLSDGITDYSSKYNVFLGKDSGAATTSGFLNTGLGYQALYSNTTACCNTAIGHVALYSNTDGQFNTAMGSQALQSNTSGPKNAAIGYQALQSNTTGGNNTASGFQALQYNTTGYNNTAMGHQALYSNTTASNNTATGYMALFINTTGQYNTATGFQALQSNTTGGNNTAMGLQALYSNTTATGNTAFGYQALYSNTTATGNTATGFHALQSNTTGNSNTASGYETLDNNSTGSTNTAIGLRALNKNTTGWYNTALGPLALYYNTTGQFNTALGVYALYTNSTGSQNTATGYQALYQVTGDNNTAIGYQAGQNITTGTYNIVIGSGVNAPSATGTSLINIGNLIYGDITNGRVGIGSASAIGTAGISLDVGYRTDSIRPAVGTTAQQPTCDASHVGAMRWNSSIGSMEWCNGGSWVQPVVSSGGGTPPTAPPGSGYFVRTQTTWDGNLGGYAGANAKCLTELTTNTNWMYYSAANSAGQLIAGKVRAWLCAGGSCQMPTPLTTYYFAVVGDSAAGGASFTTDSSGRGPGNSVVWSGYNYFAGSVKYWSGRSDGNWDAYFEDSNTTNCSNFSSNNPAGYGEGGYSAGAGNVFQRWTSNGQSCDQPNYLICMVNP